ncbi:hypothetical protein ACHAWF_006949, partial [Thalassiosira exigua]
DKTCASHLGAWRNAAVAHEGTRGALAKGRQQLSRHRSLRADLEVAGDYHGSTTQHHRVP